MLLKNISGLVLYESRQKSVKASVEEAVSKGVNLNGIDLRRARLRNASLDAMIAQCACFWGADLTGADMTGCDLTGADMRNTCLQDACMAETILKSANFRGAFFKNTILDGAVVNQAVFGNPSLFSCDLSGVHQIGRAVYGLPDGTEHVFGQSPVILRGLRKTLVILQGFSLWGDVCLPHPVKIPELRRDMACILRTIDMGRLGVPANLAKKTNLKRVDI